MAEADTAAYDLEAGKRGPQSAGTGIGRWPRSGAENLDLLRLLVKLLLKISCMHSLARLSLLVEEGMCAREAARHGYGTSPVRGGRGLGEPGFF